MRKLLLPAFVLFLSIYLSGCMTQKTIQKQLDDVTNQAYNDWSQQHQAIMDSSKTGTVNPEEIHTKKNEQPLISGKLSLKDALKIALIYNTSIQKAVENTTYAHGKIVQAYSGVVPTVTMNGTYTRIDKVATINIAGNSITAGSLNNYTFNLNFQQPLINGAAAAGLRAAKLYKALTNKEVQNATQGIVFGVEQGYDQLLMLQKSYDVNKQFLDVSEASLKDVQNKFKFGTATQFNVLRAKVDVANAKTTMIKSKNDLDQAKAAFYKLLGVSQNSSVAFQDSLEFRRVTMKEGKAVNLALQNNPELASSLLTVRLNRQNVLASYSDYFPTISAFMNQNYEYPNPHGSFFNPSNYLKYGYAWNAGLTLKWNIFNLSREGTIIQDKSEYRQQQLNFLDTKEQVLYNVHSAMLSLRNTTNAVNAQKLNVKQARDGLRLAQAGYVNGTLDQVSVLDARQALRQAELSYYSSLYDHEVARLQLLKATGQLKVSVNKNTPDNNK